MHLPRKRLRFLKIGGNKANQFGDLGDVDVYSWGGCNLLFLLFRRGEEAE